MAGPRYGMDNRDDGNVNLLSVLVSEGIEFLLSGKGKVPLSSLDQKTICLYFSAGWCRPCKIFTPQLVQLYNTLRNRGEKLEIIFVSFDRDENGFQQHFESMPWLALPFNETARKRLCDCVHPKNMPSLIPLGWDGELVGEDAVGLIEDYGIDAFPFTTKRMEELKAMDCAKRQGGKLEDLLVRGERDYVVDRDGNKILISELVGKTVGLYFGGQWCPPCRNFSRQLIDTYNELKITENRHFEIIFVSTDRNQEEYDINICTMPWLSIPYNDRARHDLSRIFDVKGIPAVILLGPDGKTITTNGRTMISTYGAMGFPFTASRIIEVEALLRKEGNALPQQVKDQKHEHVLKLDMAKAYVCDSCKRVGRFWAFSCDKCNFDLHPTCVEES